MKDGQRTNRVEHAGLKAAAGGLGLEQVERVSLARHLLLITYRPLLRSGVTFALGYNGLEKRRKVGVGRGGDGVAALKATAEERR